MRKLNLSINDANKDLRMIENFVEILYDDFSLPEDFRGRMVLSIIAGASHVTVFDNDRKKANIVEIEAYYDKEKVCITIENPKGGYDFTPDHMQNKRHEMYLLLSMTDQLLFSENGAKVTMIFFIKPAEVKPERCYLN